MSTSKVIAAQPNSGGSAGRTADMALVARCRAGDLAAFEELYSVHAGRLFSVACRMLGNASDAEDLLQEIFLSAHRKLDGFRGESALGTWLYRLATNHCLDFLRSRAARTNDLTDTLDEEPGLYRARPGGAGRADRREDGPGASDRPVAAGMPGCIRPARRRGARTPRGGRGAWHRGRHVEVAGAQGAAAASRDPRRPGAVNVEGIGDHGSGLGTRRLGPGTDSRRLRAES